MPRIPSPSGAPTNIVGIWLALDEAKIENGCMHVLVGQHQKPVLHFQRRDWQICDNQIQTNVYPIPLKAGSLMMFSSLIPHGTPPNHSDLTRRALQWHLAPENVERFETEQRLQAFGADGTGVEC